MNMQRIPRRRQRGVSLVEVLIAVLIFSLGMMGLGGLLIFAIQSNHVAFQRTQATFLARAMADRMSANPIGVWNGDYNSTTYPLNVTQDCSTGCTPDLLAVYDQQMWSSQLKTFLPVDPNLNATIACDKTKAGYVPQGTQLTLRPPYGGTCTMTIRWTEHGTASNGTNQTQTFNWAFQP